MIISVNNQALLLLAAVYGGLLLGLFFDTYRFARNIFNFGRMITCIGDFVFWIIGSAIILIIVYKSSSGLLRVYQLMGFALGMLIYIKVLSRYIIKLLYILVFCIKKFFYTMLKIVRGPLVVLSRILWAPYYRIKKIVFEVFEKMLKDAKKRINLLKNKK